MRMHVHWRSRRVPAHPQVEAQEPAVAAGRVLTARHAHSHVRRLERLAGPHSALLRVVSGDATETSGFLHTATRAWWMRLLSRESGSGTTVGPGITPRCEMT